MKIINNLFDGIIELHYRDDNSSVFVRKSSIIQIQQDTNGTNLRLIDGHNIIVKETIGQIRSNSKLDF